MKRFSERIGAVTPPSAPHVDSVTPELRNTVWNLTLSLFSGRGEYWYTAAAHYARFFFKVPTDTLPSYNTQCREWLKTRYYALEWYGFYDFAEFLAVHYRKMREYGEYDAEKIRLILNKIFEDEYSGYRFIGGVLAPITSSAEVTAIDDSIVAARASGIEGAAIHLEASLRLLGKRPQADYRNAIKEAISAVESVAKVLSPAAGSGLSGPLEELSKKVPLHAAMKAGFIKLYGYTSDEGGIRHAILEEPDVSYAEAQFMVVSCSAFVHYLLQKAGAAGLVATR